MQPSMSRIVRWLLGAVAGPGLGLSAMAQQVEFTQTAVNDANAAVLAAVASTQWIETAETVSTVAAPETWSGCRFTHWTVSSHPGEAFRDPWGRAENPVSFTLYEPTVATAHYLPAAQDSDGDGVPDWMSIHYYGTLDIPGDSDSDGDGYLLEDEYQTGRHPLYANARQPGGISRDRSGTLAVNLGGFSRFTIRSEPPGLVLQTGSVAPGSVITTSNMTESSFGYWTLDGVEQRDAWGVAERQVSFTMEETDREAVVYLFAGDSDDDGLPDAWEMVFFGTLAHGAGEDWSGDGLTLLDAYPSGRNPKFRYAHQPGGIGRDRSGTMAVNLGGFARYTIRSEPPGLVYQSGSVAPGSVITTSNMTQSAFGFWTLDGEEQRDAWGVAVRQVSFTVETTDREAVAHVFPGDSDDDGLPDGWEMAYFGMLGHEGGEDWSGDGLILLDAYQSDRNPKFRYAHQPGGMARDSTPVVLVNLQFFPPDNVFTDGGGAEGFFSNPYSGVEGGFQMAGGFSAPALGDVFGNSALDLVVGGAEGRAALWQNTGAPFAPQLVERPDILAGLPEWPAGPVYPALGDWNGDGLADLVIGSDDGWLRLYQAQADEAARFVWIGKIAAPAGDQFPALLPTEGLPDLLVLDGGSGLVRRHAWTNEVPPYGHPAVSENVLGIPVTDGLGLAAGDTDHNGWMDVVASDADGRLWHFLGQSDGSFFLKSKVFAGAQDGFHAGLRAALGDFNGNGNLDVIGGGDDGRLIFLRNPAKILRVAPTLSSVTRQAAVAFTSIDDDGTLTWSLPRNRSGATVDPLTGAYVAGAADGFDQVLARNDSGRVGAAWVNVLGLAPGESSGWRALLVEGRRGTADPAGPALHTIVRRARDVLEYRGLQADEIVWLGQGSDADAAPTRDSLAAALRDGTAVAADTDVLVVFLADHGDVSAGEDGCLVLSAEETVSGSELNAWLDALQASHPDLSVLVIVESGFGARLAGALGASGEYAERRLVLAASGADERSHLVSGGWVSYSMQWWIAAADGRTLGQAHAAAADALAPLQTAWSAGSDALAGRVLGMDDVAGATRPVVEATDDSLTLEGMEEARLEVAVQSSFAIERVWGVVIPPGYVPDGDLPVLDLPELELALNPSTGLWEVQAVGFAESGSPYVVMLMARDIWGQVSPPVQVRVERQASLRHRVVIFAPGESSWTGMGTALNLSAYARDVALLRGIAPTDIRFFADHPGDLAVDGPTTAAALQDAIESWAVADGPPEALTLFLVGQGSPHGLVCANGDRVTHQHDSLRGWVNAFQDENDAQVYLIVDADYSGRFISVGGGDNRVVVTSTGPDDRNRYIDGEWVGIVRWIWEAIARGRSLQSGFAEATAWAARFGDIQALLDDDGDGRHQAGRDGARAAKAFVGSPFVAGDDPPAIGRASVSRSIEAGQAARFWVADVVMPDGGRPERVWGEAVGPDGSRRGEAALWHNEELDRYDGLFADFAEPGTYEMFLRAGTPGHPTRMSRPVVVQFHCGLDDEPGRGRSSIPMPFIALPLSGAYMDVETAEGMDWRLDLQAGQRVTIEAREVAPRRDVMLEIRDADGLLLLAENGWGAGLGETIRGWEAPAEGTYLVRARFMGGQGPAYCRVRATVAYEAVDLDGGSLDVDAAYEAWAREIYGDDYEENAGLDDDPLGSGLTNWEAFVARIDPRNPIGWPPEIRMDGMRLRMESSAQERLYFVDFKTNLLDGAWRPLLYRQGSGDALTIDLDGEDPHRFYRFRIEMP